MLNLVFLLSSFVTVFYLLLCTLIGQLSHAIHEHSCRSQHISVLTTCIYICVYKFAPLNLHSLRRRDVEDASSFLRASTSSFRLIFDSWVSYRITRKVQKENVKMFNFFPKGEVASEWDKIFRHFQRASLNSRSFLATLEFWESVKRELKKLRARNVGIYKIQVALVIVCNRSFFPRQTLFYAAWIFYSAWILMICNKVL